jgi:hypothetical protein
LTVALSAPTQHHKPGLPVEKVWVSVLLQLCGQSSGRDHLATDPT